MRLAINPKSKTLWLQGLIALAAIFFPDQIAELCAAAGDESVRNVVLTQCALTAAAYVIKFQKKASPDEKPGPEGSPEGP